jgi:uncharacterized SAM-binding protein YcdF (DUF218 family)
MAFYLRELLDVLIQPADLLVVLLTVGALTLAFGRQRAGGALVGFVAVMSIAIMVLPVADWVSAPLENRFTRSQLPARIDGIVLLGGAVRMDMTEERGDVALNGMAERITATLALAHRYAGVPVVVSGGDVAHVSHGFSEAEATMRLLVADGLDARRIVVEGRSQNTWENALYSKDVAHPEAGQVWVLVTSANHMPRAIGCFRHVGWPVLPYPVDYRSGNAAEFDFDSARSLETLGYAVHEWLGLVEYRLLGRIDSIFPAPLPPAS